MASRPARQSSSLWRHRDFLLLWAGQCVSETGSAVTTLALPLTAVVVLRASTLEIGLLSAATTAAFLFIALPSGALVDRMAKRRVMVVCDAARMLVIGSVPLAAATGVLTLGQLFGVALVAGVATVFFDVSYQSYVPTLVRRDQLIDANGKLTTTAELARVAGPGVGGGLVGLVGAAGAMTADAVSYAVSVASLLAIRTREPREVTGDAGPSAPRRGLRELGRDTAAGLRFVLAEPVLRKIVACTGTSNLFGSMMAALEIVFLVRILHVTPAGTGLLVALSALGGVAGGALCARLSRWIGSARIIWVAIVGFGATLFLVPLARPGWGVAFYVVGWAGFSFSSVTYNVAQVSYRQAICPPELMGRMNAAVRWIVWGTLPLGGLLGGALGSALGVRPTMWVGAAGAWLGGLWLLFSPLRTMRDTPAQDRVGATDPAGPELPDTALPSTQP
ncbi:MAG TPA: MFS transporter [Streptosporangiaceae bacterium]|nr:MFS transporter [Streptosporangiaceae bacterium]